MTKLDGIDVEGLREHLTTTESPKAMLRLVIALGYKDGESVDTLSQRYGVPKSTVYYWLDRFESRSIDEALEDDPRSGRPGRLTGNERLELEAMLADPPDDHGYDADEWTTALVRRHIASAYGVEYSSGHVRRLLREVLELSK